MAKKTTAKKPNAKVYSAEEQITIDAMLREKRLSAAESRALEKIKAILEKENCDIHGIFTLDGSKCYTTNTEIKSKER